MIQVISRLTNDELREVASENSINYSQLSSIIKELLEAREMLSKKKCLACDSSKWMNYKDDYCMPCRNLFEYGGSEG